jgi:Trk K+ transport system NAD-binding subunit
MRIAVLGTGPVGQPVAAKLAELDHEVRVGTRDHETTMARTEPDNVDLGHIATARGTEMFLPLWARIWGATQQSMFNIKVVR